MAKFVKENADIVRAAERLRSFGKQSESQPGLAGVAGGKKKKKRKTLISGGKRPKTLLGR